MDSYKAEVTLNEKDTLQDMLLAEKSLVSKYAMCLVEGASMGFRTKLKSLLTGLLDDQLKVFLLMTEKRLDTCFKKGTAG